MQTVKSQVNLLLATDIIGALQNILAHSQVIMPDLDTPYSRPGLPSTNYFATELDQSIIGDIVTERQQQLDAILPEISSLETVIDSIQILHGQLVEQKAKIIESIHLHNRVRSALWRLPTEILSQIFDHCVPETTECENLKILSVLECEKLKILSVLEVPMLLTTVCRRWREVAVAMPSLWCRLAMSVAAEGQWERRISCYDSWLKQSRGRPLSLALYNNSCAYDWTKLLHLLRPHVNQISSLYINFPEEDEPKSFLEVFCSALQLQELTIDTMGMPGIKQCISRLPSTLRSLKFVQTTFDLEIISLCNPIWTHLTSVALNIDEPDAVLHLLQLAPNLSSLTITTGIDGTQDLEPFTHTKLQSLHITSDSYISTSRLSDLFDALSLPNLRIFEASGEPPWPHMEFMAFLTRSRCPLETLILSAEVGTSEEERAEYVALIPSLQVIVLPEEEDSCFEV